MPNAALVAIILPIALLGSGFADRNGMATGKKPTVRTIRSIPAPAGYQRPDLPPQGFAEWLRGIPLHPVNTVYLFDGRLKINQQAHVAVLDIPVGKRDLQQCADACMRLRAEYLVSAGKMQDIVFTDAGGKAYRAPALFQRGSFERYLETVFSWCGTASLEKQLRALPARQPVLPGDVVINGGYPGHAVMVVDMAVHPSGEMVYLLAQSYMPAQQIHILKNPNDKTLSPWFRVCPGQVLHTPEWTFAPARVRRW